MTHAEITPVPEAQPTPADDKPARSKADKATQEANLKQHAAEQEPILEAAREAGELALRLIRTLNPETQAVENQGIITWKSAIIDLDPFDARDASHHPEYGQIYAEFIAAPGPQRRFRRKGARTGEPVQGEPWRVGIHWWTSNDGSESYPYHSTQEWDGSSHGRPIDVQQTLAALQAVGDWLLENNEPT